MLSYDALLQKTLESIPEFKTEYEKLRKEDEIDKDTGNHIVFGYVFVPLVLKSIEQKDERLTNVLFGFLEEMASSKDNKVVEVCDYSVLEALNDNLNDNVLEEFMGVNTKIGFNAIKRYML